MIFRRYRRHNGGLLADIRHRIVSVPIALAYYSFDDDVGVHQHHRLASTDRILDSWTATPDLEPTIDREVRDAAVYKSVTAGTDLFHRSDPCSHIAVVGSGNLRVYAQSDEGRQITMYRIGRGETCLLTLTCVLGELAHAGHAVTETDAEVALLPAERFRSWVDRSPALRRYVFSFISVQTAGLVELIEALFLPVDRRLAGMLLNAFGDREQLSATHSALAADAGTSREVVSRYLKEFERQGAVDLGRGVIDLRDRAALESLTEDDQDRL